MSKAEWKQTGTELGHAFKGLGKPLVRTIKTGTDKAMDWAEEADSPAKDNTEDNVVVDIPADEE